jgi:hypothetical protein
VGSWAEAVLFLTWQERGGYSLIGAPVTVAC